MWRIARGSKGEVADGAKLAAINLALCLDRAAPVVQPAVWTLVINISHHHNASPRRRMILSLEPDASSVPSLFHSTQYIEPLLTSHHNMICVSKQTDELVMALAHNKRLQLILAVRGKAQTYSQSAAIGPDCQPVVTRMECDGPNRLV